METSTRPGAASCSLSFLLALGAFSHLQAQDEAQPTDRSLRFAWPVPSDVYITERRVQGARVLELQYRVELRSTDADDVLVVRRRDFQILKVDGLDVTAAQFEPVLAPMKAQMGIMPDIRIDSRGRVLGMEAWDSYVSRFRESVADLIAGNALTADHGERIHQLLEQPSTRESIHLGAADFWDIWVSGWLGNDFNKNADVEVEGKFTLPNGSVIIVPRVLRHNGPEEDREGYVRLSTQSQMGGDRVKAQIVAMTRELRQVRPVPPRVAEQSIQSAEVANATWVVLRPGTMQPLEAEIDNRIIIQAADGKKEEVQSRHFKFDWK